jgi:DHA1 family tetracycline resistance protein-like MFS transporter
MLPESLPAERRTPTINWSRANPFGAFLFLRERGELLGLATVGFLFQLSRTVLPTIFVLYTSYRYGWTPDILGWTFMASGICMVLVQVFLVGPVVKAVGERGAVLIGAFFGTFGFLIYALAYSPWIYVAGIPIFALLDLMNPGLLGLMSRRVGVQHQGQLQGVNQSLQGVSSVIGPLIFGLIFAWSVRQNATLHLPGLAILVSAGLLVIALALSVRVAHPVNLAAAPA